MKLDAVEIEKHFKGYFVYDCAIRAKNVFSFILFQHSDSNVEPQKRLIIKRIWITLWKE